MRRLIISAVLTLGTFALVRRLKRTMQLTPTLHERMAGKCERMLTSMPASFPPNRMMADLETVKTRTALILDTLNERSLAATYAK